jgi:hypothetical protein
MTVSALRELPSKSVLAAETAVFPGAQKFAPGVAAKRENHRIIWRAE